MKSRDFGLLGIGLIVGLVIGILLLSSSDDLRQSLFGTAGLNPSADPAYFLVDMDQSRNWLAERFPAEEEAITTAFSALAPLTDPEANFREAITSAQPEIDFLVARAYTGLVGAEPLALPTGLPALAADQLPSALLPSLADGIVSTCLGIDENPYNLDGYTLFFYMQVPSTQTSVLPTTWERLDEPKDDDLYWQRLACQTLPQGGTAQRR